MDSRAPADARIVDWLGTSQAAMESLLGRIVDIDSPSSHVAGINAVGDEIASFLTEHGIAVERAGNERSARLLKVSVNGNADAPPILLMGHMDTVFPLGTAPARPFEARGDRLHGPGVADMKSGLVMNAFVLAAFAQFGDGQPLDGLFTIDEEIASPVSRDFILDAARDAAFVLNAEPARKNGNVVIERKGGLFLRIEVSGKSAHAGVDFVSGVSAISELAHKIVALGALTDIPDEITVNVGLVSGGQSINTVAPRAGASVDIRYAREEQRASILEKVGGIVDAMNVPGTTARLEIIGEFLPMMPTADSLALLESYREASASLGLGVEGEATGGCSDAGLTASLGVPTLCGTGPVGGNAHTDDEYIERDSLVTRAQALALVILRHRSERRKTAVSDRN